MVQLDELATAALNRDAFRLRELVQDWLRQNPRLNECPMPTSQDRDISIIAAGLVELLAERLSQSPPPWTARFGPMREPFFLLKSAQTMPRLRKLCEDQSPSPLRRRRIFAPADFLSFA